MIDQNTVEETFLELVEGLDFSDCESAHDSPGNETCLGRAVAVVSSCQVEKRMCASALAFNWDTRAQFVAMHAHCSYCNRRFDECWKVEYL